MLYAIILTFQAIFRLAIPMVDGIHESTSNARSHLHNTQRIPKIRASNRVGNDVLWLHIYVPKNGYGSTKASTSIEAIKDKAFRTNVRNRRTGSNVAPYISGRDKRE